MSGARMNKKPTGGPGVTGNNRATQLEKDLMGEAFEQKQEIDTGRPRHTQKSNMSNRSKHFYIQQGTRMRHPERVLHQYKGVTATTDNVNSVYEKALMHDQERVSIPSEYKMSGADGMIAGQLGLVTTALDNFKKSKEKLRRVHMVSM